MKPEQDAGAAEEAGCWYKKTISEISDTMHLAEMSLERVTSVSTTLAEMYKRTAKDPRRGNAVSRQGLEGDERVG
jgi:hypothetical protein